MGKMVSILGGLLLGGSSLLAQNEKSNSMVEWQYPYEVHTLALSDGQEIAYVDEGAGQRTLVFVHGLGSNLKAWQKTIDDLKSDYRCIALDLPGYGKSGKGEYSFHMSFFADAVGAFMDSLGLENVVLVGHSMGGQIALHVVLSGFPAIEGLVLIAPAGFETFTEQDRAWFQAVFTPQILKALPEEQIVKNFEMNFYDMPEDARFMISDRLLMRQSPEYDHYCNMIPRCVEGMLREPVYERLQDIRVPTLVVFGENDLLIPNRLLHPNLTTRAVAESGARRIPECRLEMVSRAGHFVHWEQSEKVNSLLRDFLANELLGK